MSDPKELSQWLALTVRLVSRSEEGKGATPAVHSLSNDMMDITGQVMGWPKEREVYEGLRTKLIESVIEKAIGYSRLLRQQLSHIGVVLPTYPDRSDDHDSEPKFIPVTPPDEATMPSKRSAKEAQIFTRPELLRCSAVTGERIEENVRVIESETFSLRLKRSKESR